VAGFPRDLQEEEEEVEVDRSAVPYVSAVVTRAEPSFVRPDPETAAKALTARAASPSPTFPLILVSVTVAVLALHADRVSRYSADAFAVAVVATVALAWVVARVVGTTPPGASRAIAATLLPAIGGALLGSVVQALVLRGVAPGADPVADLHGFVSTSEPVSWIASGIVLGAVPALAVSIFLLLAARALKRLTGHDAPEGFSVAFTGASGLFAALGLVVVDAGEAGPLVAVAGASLAALLIATLVDGARLRLLRDAWAGAEGAFEIVPAARFAADASLAPLVGGGSGAGPGATGSVLVKIDRRPGSYRGAAAEPIALVGDTEEASTRPLRRRRAAALSLVAAIAIVSTLASLAHLAHA
jgi:hypothetical protein